MDIKEILKTMNSWLLSIAKSLQAGNNDEAIDLLTKQAEHVQELIEKSEETPPEDPQEPEEDIDPSDDDPGDIDPDKEPIEKTVPVQLTKAQTERLQKFVEMYISAWDVADFVGQFDAIKERVSKLEKSSQQMDEDPTELKKSTLSGILTVG